LGQEELSPIQILSTRNHVRGAITCFYDYVYD